MKAALTRAHTIASVAIRARVWQNWSHGIIIPASGLAIDSTFKLNGVRDRPLAEAMHGATAIRHMDFVLDREREALDWLWHLVETKAEYDLHCIVGFATGDRDWRDDRAWFCWELIAAAIEKGSSYRFENVSRVTPRELLIAERILKGLPA